jgi:NAD(P)H-hydrate epimerase
MANKSLETSRTLLKQAYPKREPYNHKGQHGKLLVIAGSQQYTGTPIFNCMAALRAGVDLVQLYSCRRAADIAAGFAPDIITIPYEGKWLGEASALKAIALLPQYDALVIGGGLGSQPETHKAVRQILSKCLIPAVVDADAIRSLKVQAPGLLKAGQFVLTPHENEFLDLGGQHSEPKDLLGRQEQVRRVAAKWKNVVLLKGHVDVVSDGSAVWLNRTGSPLMTKGGGGDCLAGICGALLARKLPPLQAACTAAYINGKAGEASCKRFGEGYVASDLLQAIPQAIK